MALQRGHHPKAPLRGHLHGTGGRLRKGGAVRG
eukprot:CAMPEP_0174333782 /NCGR_PEP_ID=MMETSP0810-20121108/19417_1 /TAXON_ID=73025 ORGANISM="Eutreptiella gymnastica-like, Strain CCMP1594" /NCGR_SAMPLE_ID=MMETSP0810 /ASSEMBLY_ACC=CAM_ASM_000659 /LENGTH=32 /DNA_ID= /DNA_START= /DNA_END= /DNA_ORIENTATION=